jgi:hypothetical protein
VHIEKGTKDGARIVIRGEAGDAPGMEPGDVVFAINCKAHPTFQRTGDDLIMVKDIPLVDALTGASFTFRHLNGKLVTVSSAPGVFIQPGEVKMVRGKGMPKAGTGGMRFGDLIVKVREEWRERGERGESARVRAMRCLFRPGPVPFVSCVFAPRPPFPHPPQCNVVLPTPKAVPASVLAQLKSILPRDMDAEHRQDAKYRRQRGEDGAGAEDGSEDIEVDDAEVARRAAVTAAASASKSPRKSPGGKSAGGAAASPAKKPSKTFDGDDGMNVGAGAGDGDGGEEEEDTGPEEVRLVDCDLRAKAAERESDRRGGGGGGGGGEAYDEDEEGGGGGGGVQCAQQ